MDIKKEYERLVNEFERLKSRTPRTVDQLSDIFSDYKRDVLSLIKINEDYSRYLNLFPSEFDRIDNDLHDASKAKSKKRENEYSSEAREKIQDNLKALISVIKTQEKYE